MPGPWTFARRLSLGVGVALALGGAAVSGPDAPTARLDTGVVAGLRSGPAAVYHAIPYAAPPVGPLRWKPPAPAKRWSGVLTLGPPGPACMQVILPGGIPNIGGYTGPVSEDCLTLDVTAPLDAAPAPGHRAKAAPVLVWIPGGGNTAGGANVPSYDAVNFARDGVIVVTMNYRLAALGFFAHPALTREAGKDAPLVNYGLMDQIAALKWVKRNIAAFGGDPNNVTLSGESAGGGDTLALMTLPAARGLYRRSIVESGGGWGPPATLAEREADGAALAGKLGLPGAAATADQLRALPASALIASAGGMAEDGRMMRESVTAAFAKGHAADVPLIIGSNSNEASLMGLMGGVGETPSPALKAAYADAATEAELRRQMFNDHFMGAPARWIAAREAGGAPVWLYYFSYVPERQRQNAEGTNRSARPGTNHASEIPFVFDSLDAVPGRTPLIQPSERAAAALTHACWVGFIKTGVPACGDQAWPVYTPTTDQLLEIGIDSGVRAHFRKPQLDAQDASVAPDRQ